MVRQYLLPQGYKGHCQR